MTHLSIAAVAGFIFTFGATEITVSPEAEIITVSIHTSDCSESTKRSIPLPLTKPAAKKAANPNGEVICGSVSLDDQDQPRCNLQLIA